MLDFGHTMINISHFILIRMKSVRTSSLLSSLSLICWQNTGSRISRHSGILNNFESTNSLIQILFDCVNRPGTMFVKISTITLLDFEKNIELMRYFDYFMWFHRIIYLNLTASYTCVRSDAIICMYFSNAPWDRSKWSGPTVSLINDCSKSVEEQLRNVKKVSIEWIVSFSYPPN